jgi:hypothetical protein
MHYVGLKKEKHILGLVTLNLPVEKLQCYRVVMIIFWDYLS